MARFSKELAILVVAILATCDARGERSYFRRYAQRRQVPEGSWGGPPQSSNNGNCEITLTIPGASTGCNCACTGSGSEPTHEETPVAEDLVMPPGGPPSPASSECGTQNPFCNNSSPPAGPPPPMPPGGPPSPRPMPPGGPPSPASSECGTQNPFCNNSSPPAGPPPPMPPGGPPSPASSECGTQNPFCNNSSPPAGPPPPMPPAGPPSAPTTADPESSWSGTLSIEDEFCSHHYNCITCGIQDPSTCSPDEHSSKRGQCYYKWSSDEFFNNHCKSYPKCQTTCEVKK